MTIYKFMIPVLLLGANADYVAAKTRNNHSKDSHMLWEVSVGTMFSQGFISNSLPRYPYCNFSSHGHKAILFSVAKPVIANLTLGVDMEDFRFSGILNATNKQLNTETFTEYYLLRIQSFNLFARYQFLRGTKIHPFITAKTGITEVTRNFSSWSVNQVNSRNISLLISNEETSRYHNQLFCTLGTGISWRMYPYLSVSVSFENTAYPKDFVDALPLEITDKRINAASNNAQANFGRITISLTSHSGFYFLFPSNKSRKIRLHHIDDKYLPFYKPLKRK